MLEHFQWFYLPRANIFQPSRSSSHQMRGFFSKIGPHFLEIVVIGFTKNERSVGRNNVIHNFDIWRMSKFLQGLILCNILSN